MFKHTASLIFICSITSAAQADPDAKEARALLQTVDEHQRYSGDFHSDMYMEQKEKGKLTVVYETQVFRRHTDDQLVVLFTAPKSSQGQGYLRIDKNLWFYDPAVGKWERRTERERIGGTNSRRADFDESHLSEDYDPTYVASEKLGAYDAVVLKLTAKAGREPTYPVVKVWIDKDSKNVLKREEYAASGRLLRTCYYPKWKKTFSALKQGDVWYPEESRIYDEIEKENSTTMMVRSVDLEELDATIFSKAWLESKSR